MTATETKDDAKEFTWEHLDAAACMWEHVLNQLRRAKPADKNPWDEYRQAYGMAALRDTVINHAVTLQAEYEGAVENGYDQAFDWEFVPKYMEDHVTRILT